MAGAYLPLNPGMIHPKWNSYVQKWILELVSVVEGLGSSKVYKELKDMRRLIMDGLSRWSPIDGKWADLKKITSILTL